MLITKDSQGWLALLLASYVMFAFACVPAARRLPPKLNEISGAVLTKVQVDETSEAVLTKVELVESKGSKNALIALVDGGNPGQLYQLQLKGRRSSQLSIQPPSSKLVQNFGDSLSNLDWEALSIDTILKQILICDVGDNSRSRQNLRFYRLSLTGDLLAQHTLTYPDGPHDCEACLFRDGRVLLITKAQTLGGAKTRRANVYAADLTSANTTLSLIDSFNLHRRSVTDAVWIDYKRIAVLAYDFQIFGILPFERTSLYTGTFQDFRQNLPQHRKIRSPFSLNQYETLALISPTQALIASERTPLSRPHIRRIKLMID